MVPSEFWFFSFLISPQLEVRFLSYVQKTAEMGLFRSYLLGSHKATEMGKLVAALLYPPQCKNMLWSQIVWESRRDFWESRDQSRFLHSWGYKRPASNTPLSCFVTAKEARSKKSHFYSFLDVTQKPDLQLGWY